MFEILWYCICLFTSCLFTGLAFMGFLVEFLCENVPIIKICNALIRSSYLTGTAKEVSINTVECTEGVSQKDEFRPWLCSQVTIWSSSGSSLNLSTLSSKVGLRLVDVWELNEIMHVEPTTLYVFAALRIPSSTGIIRSYMYRTELFQEKLLTIKFLFT